MSIDNSNIKLVTNNHNKNSSITTPNVSQGTRNSVQIEDDENVEVRYNKTNICWELSNDKTDAHILSIIGTRYKHVEDVIKQEDRHRYQNMKTDYLKFTRKHILCGY